MKHLNMKNLLLLKMLKKKKPRYTEVYWKSALDIKAFITVLADRILGSSSLKVTIQPRREVLQPVLTVNKHKMCENLVGI